MSFYEEKKGNSIQEYLQIGREQRFYLRNKNKPDSVNAENVLAAIDALKIKNLDSFDEKEDYLLSMLPPKERDQYRSKRIEELYKMADKHISFLSDPELKRQYQGDRTKDRPPQIKSTTVTTSGIGTIIQTQRKQLPLSTSRSYSAPPVKFNRKSSSKLKKKKGKVSEDVKND